MGRDYWQRGARGGGVTQAGGGGAEGVALVTFTANCMCGRDPAGPGGMEGGREGKTGLEGRCESPVAPLPPSFLSSLPPVFPSVINSG